MLIVIAPKEFVDDMFVDHKKYYTFHPERLFNFSERFKSVCKKGPSYMNSNEYYYRGYSSSNISAEEVKELQTLYGAPCVEELMDHTYSITKDSFNVYPKIYDKDSINNTSLGDSVLIVFPKVFNIRVEIFNYFEEASLKHRDKTFQVSIRFRRTGRDMVTRTMRNGIVTELEPEIIELERSGS